MTPTRLPARPRALIAHKTTQLELFESDSDREAIHLLERLSSDQDLGLRDLRESADSHRESLERVVETLDRRGWDLTIRHRAEVEDVSRFDIIVSLGGDGTVLDLSHRIKDNTPLLAINSDPVSSVGYFCACSADTLEETLDDMEAGRLRVFRLSRINLFLDGEELAAPVLNDLLIADENPAMTCKYVLGVGEHREVQRSSGIWISTPAGSTAAVRSAGGFVLPLESRLLQYLVREPFPPMNGRYRLLRGVQHFEEELTVQSLMRTGRIYVDGPWASFPFQIGQTLRIVADATPLALVGINEALRLT